MFAHVKEIGFYLVQNIFIMDHWGYNSHVTNTVYLFISLSNHLSTYLNIFDDRQSNAIAHSWINFNDSSQDCSDSIIQFIFKLIIY